MFENHFKRTLLFINCRHTNRNKCIFQYVDTSLLFIILFFSKCFYLMIDIMETQGLGFARNRIYYL